jgi:hypothetical protein
VPERECLFPQLLREHRPTKRSRDCSKSMHASFSAVSHQSGALFSKQASSDKYSQRQRQPNRARFACEYAHSCSVRAMPSGGVVTCSCTPRQQRAAARRTGKRNSDPPRYTAEHARIKAGNTGVAALLARPEVTVGWRKWQTTPGFTTSPDRPGMWVTGTRWSR